MPSKAEEYRALARCSWLHSFFKFVHFSTDAKSLYGILPDPANDQTLRKTPSLQRMLRSRVWFIPSSASISCAAFS